MRAIYSVREWPEMYFTSIKFTLIGTYCWPCGAKNHQSMINHSIVFFTNPTYSCAAGALKNFYKNSPPRLNPCNFGIPYANQPTFKMFISHGTADKPWKFYKNCKGMPMGHLYSQISQQIEFWGPHHNSVPMGWNLAWRSQPSMSNATHWCKVSLLWGENLKIATELSKHWHMFCAHMLLTKLPWNIHKRMSMSEKQFHDLSSRTSHFSKFIKISCRTPIII